MPKFLTLVDRDAFPYSPPEFPGATLYYRHLTLEMLETLNAKHRKVHVVNGVTIREEGGPETLAERIHQQFDYVLVRWEGVVDDAGVPVPCDEPNRRLFERLYPDTRRKLLDLAQSDAPSMAEAVRPNS